MWDTRWLRQCLRYCVIMYACETLSYNQRLSTWSEALSVKGRREGNFVCVQEIHEKSVVAVNQWLFVYVRKWRPEWLKHLIKRCDSVCAGGKQTGASKYWSYWPRETALGPDRVCELLVGDNKTGNQWQRKWLLEWVTERMSEKLCESSMYVSRFVRDYNRDHKSRTMCCKNV